MKWEEKEWYFLLESTIFSRTTSLLKGYSGSFSSPLGLPQRTTVWSPSTAVHLKNLQKPSSSSPGGVPKDVKFLNQGQLGKV